MALVRRRCGVAIDGGLRGKLAPGTRLTARYKGTLYEVAVVSGDDGKTRYRLPDGREFRSPSAAGSAVMAGQACNGYRFWSVADSTAPGAPEPLGRTLTAIPLVRPRCAQCGKTFGGRPQLAHHEANAARLCRPA